ncbi:50S ribosomal protein L5 [Rubellicoccus peritrichatus]|uniref:Large ribosomal subunit protein uL5 n=1 Tax=Rubellicoccus peritrichatus TaxID=3080537 RepID=A0AAQ3QY63_9BACT|nr:50S ribosomal protein L5 [Puniceicoccus sp. CR14]WOO43500.1 50S ribosomal protein L5 [Puniceicoccus sp. CR14]
MEQPYLKKYYLDEVVAGLTKKFAYSNRHQVPSVSKIVINSGFNPNNKDKNWIADLQKDITSIAGQRAVVTKAKKSVSNFKLREGMPNGVMVTLRGRQMYDFLYRFIAIALPSIRDFRGVGSKLDGSGNYNIGITDHTIFPEISGDTGSRGNIGMDITIVTDATTDDEGRELLRMLGMPFRKSTPTPEEEAAAAS